MNIDDAIACTIKECRLKKNISQEALAGKACLHRTYISLLERGLRKPTLKVIYIICKQLGITIEDFISIVNEKTTEY